MENVEHISITDPFDRNIFLEKKDGKLSKIQISLFREAFKVDEKQPIIAILGDTHGHLEEPLEWLAEISASLCISINAILHTGDIVESAVESDLASFGLMDLTGNRIDSLLTHSLSKAHLYFIEGNHDENTDLSAYNFNEKINYLSNGSVLDLQLAGNNIRIGALGWNSSRGQIRNVINENCHVVLSHSWIDMKLSKNGFHFFGHHKNALQRSNFANNSYGLDHSMRHRRIPGSVGLFFFNETESLFLYLPTEIS